MYFAGDMLSPAYHKIFYRLGTVNSKSFISKGLL